MKLILGQGNPGKKYAKTRHNLGFMALDYLAEKFAGSWQTKPKWQAEIAEIKLFGETVLLVKPTCFYNLTGQVLRQIGDFYKLAFAQDILVVCDDLALDFGNLRVRQQGSDGGNNGLKSIIAHVGQNFWRLRIGTKNPLAKQVDSADFVLSKLTADEKTTLPIICQKIETFVINFVRNELVNDSQKIYKHIKTK